MYSTDTLMSENRKYRPPDDEEVGALLAEFLNGCGANDMSEDNVELFNVGIDEDAIIKIIDQVRRRKLYFYVYHEISDLNEPKETALYVFWLLKLQPFYWKGGYKGSKYKSGYELNAKIALNFLLQGLNLYATQKTRRSLKAGQNMRYEVNIGRDGNMTNFNNLYHSFRFRDLSKEAIMDLAEGLIIGISTTQQPSKAAIRGYAR